MKTSQGLSYKPAADGWGFGTALFGVFTRLCAGENHG
jgi:hypothetical protein